MKWILSVLFFAGWSSSSFGAISHYQQFHRRIMNTIQPPTGMETYRANPIPRHDQAFTERNYQEQLQTFYLRNIVDGYRQHGERHPAWDEAAIDFLTAMVSYILNLNPDAPTLAEVTVQAAALDEQQCPDPAVLYMQGIVLKDHKDFHQAKQKLLSAAVAFDQRTYPAFLQCLVAHRLQDIYKTHGHNHEVHCVTWQRRLGQWLQTAWVDGSYQPEEKHIAVRHIHRLWNFSHIYSQRPGIYQALAETPKLDPWLADMIKAEELMDRAWQARGSGWARDVTKEGWIKFADYLGQARVYLVRSWEAHPEVPEAAAEMIKLAMAGHAGPEETMRQWFDRAVTAQMDYYPAYTHILWGLLPRWGGSHKKMIDFGLECYRTGRFDTQVPHMLFKVLVDIDNDTERDHRYWTYRGVPEALQDIFTRYLDESWGDRKLNNQALLTATAWRCGLDALAMEHLQTYESTMRPDIIKSQLGVTLDDIKADLVRRSHPGFDLINRAEREITAGHLAASQDLLDQFRNEFPGELPDAVASQLRDLDVRVDIETQLQSGEWVDLTFSDGFPGWRIESGAWEIRDNHTVVGASSQQGLMILLAISPGHAFEATGDLVFMNTLYAGPFNAGFVVGDDETPIREFTRITAYKSSGDVRWTQWNVHSTNWLFSCPVPDSISFSVEVHPRHMIVTFGDGTQKVEYTKDLSFAEGPKRFGVGGSYWFEQSNVMFKNLRIRRLDPVIHSQGESDDRSTNLTSSN